MPTNMRAKAEEKRAKARALRQQGRTYKEIGAELGVSHQRACQYCSDMTRPLDLCAKCGNKSRILYVVKTKGKEERICPGCHDEPKKVAA